jgi:hypothetical protein
MQLYLAKFGFDYKDLIFNVFLGELLLRLIMHKYLSKKEVQNNILMHLTRTPCFLEESSKSTQLNAFQRWSF